MSSFKSEDMTFFLDILKHAGAEKAKCVLWSDIIDNQKLMSVSNTLQG